MDAMKSTDPFMIHFGDLVLSPCFTFQRYFNSEIYCVSSSSPYSTLAFKVLSGLILSLVLYITYVLLALPQRSQCVTSS